MKTTLFIGTRKGLFLATTDDRTRWNIEGPFFKGWEVTAGERTPGGAYLAATTSYVYGPAIHRSPDLRTWSQFESSPSFQGGAARSLKQIWFVTASDHAWYAGVADAALFRSTDEGRSWDSVAGLSDHPTRSRWQPGAGGLCAHTLVIDPDDPRRMWCGISAVGVFRTEDAGETWEPKNEGVTCAAPDEEDVRIGYCVHALAVAPDDSNLIYRQDHKGMYRSLDGADTWERIQNGLPSTFGFPLAIDRGNGTLYCFPLESDEYRMPPEGRARVFRTVDRGESWNPLTSGLPQSHAYLTVLRRSMVADSQDPCGVYFGTTSGQVFISADGGESWNQLPANFPRIHCLEVFND
jgi:hypothetical protein